MHATLDPRWRPRDPAPVVPVAARRVAAVALVAYGVGLAVVALWPTHIDAPAAPFLEWVIARVPYLTYNRIEFAANIALFMPLGFLLAVLLPRRRWLVLPAAFSATVLIETLQRFADDRTSSVLDVVANTAGAALGLALALLVFRRR